jgi:hypothetical protein
MNPPVQLIYPYKKRKAKDLRERNIWGAAQRKQSDNI